MIAKQTRFARRFLRIAIVCVISGVSIATQAFATGAPATPTTPCDPAYMDAIEARAYLEAQREISQNQNLIFKPDSVLQYTCFDSFLNQVGGDTNWRNDHPFSDDDVTWGVVPGQGPGSLLTSLSDVVEGAVDTYLTTNFDNDFLGGRDTGENYQSPGTLVGSSYSCDKMKLVWLNAQCMDFMNQDSRDGFYDFPWYTSNDPREYPDNSDSCKSPTKLNNNIGYAFDNLQTSYTLQTENPWPTGTVTAYKTDPVVTHFDLIMPQGTAVGASSTAVTCAAPIPTGVCVVRSSFSSVYADAVCPNPGCHYDVSSVGNSASTTPAASDCTTKNPLPIGTCKNN